MPTEHGRTGNGSPLLASTPRRRGHGVVLVIVLVTKFTHGA